MRLTFALVYLIILNIILFRETLTPLQITGIVLAPAGIAWVVAECHEGFAPRTSLKINSLSRNW
jgi:drug/metabolite transporter (DMT)-like permease